MKSSAIRVLTVASLLSASSSLAAQEPKPSTPTRVLQSAAVLGVVIDSINTGGLVDAVILIEGTTLSTLSNPAGEFRFDSIPPGTRRFLLRHPLVDSIAIDIVSAPIELSAGRTSLVALAVPSSQTLRRVLCPARDTARGVAFVRGWVSDPDTDSAIVGAKVSLLYSELRISADSGVRRHERVREATTTRGGTFIICGLPKDVAGTIMATYEKVSTPEVPVRRGVSEVMFRNLTIVTGDLAAQAVAQVSAPADSTAPAAPVFVLAREGRAVLQGRVIGPDSLPVPEAQVAVAGTSQLVYTGPDGSFVLERLPSGTSEVMARKIGFAPVSAVVNLTAREPRDVTLVMIKTPTLAPVHVVATITQRLTRAGFYDRKKMGMGKFVDAEEIARRQPMQVTDILRMIPGFRIVEGERGRHIVPTRSVTGQSGNCVNLFVDRARWEMSEPGELDRAFQVHEIAAIETYGGDFVPQEFIVPTKYCPTIVIWTKTRLDEK